MSDDESDDEREDARLMRWLRSNRGAVERAIVGGLKQCLHAHGPITKEWTGSAAKRVRAALKELLNAKRRKGAGS